MIVFTAYEWFLGVLLVEFRDVELVFCRAHCSGALSVSSAYVLSAVSKLFDVAVNLNRIIIWFLSSLVLLTSYLINLLSLIEIKGRMMKLQIRKLCRILWSHWILVLRSWTNVVWVIGCYSAIKLSHLLRIAWSNDNGLMLTITSSSWTSSLSCLELVVVRHWFDIDGFISRMSWTLTIFSKMIVHRLDDWGMILLVLVTWTSKSIHHQIVCLYDWRMHNSSVLFIIIWSKSVVVHISLLLLWANLGGVRLAIAC